MYRYLLIPILVLTALTARSQSPAPAAMEDSLYRMFTQFRRLGSPEEKRELNDRVIAFMQRNLEGPETFHYRFDSLRRHVGILESGDNRFRIFTWNVPMSAYEHEYHGILQVRNGGNSPCRVITLHNRLEEIPDLLHAETDSETWPGALYYDIRREKYGKEIIYTLMGFHFNDRWSDKKIIEVLHFDPDNKPLFGKPVFKTPDGIQHRVVFEFSGDVTMSLRYNPDLKMIVYDHLSPIEPELRAYPRFYAPDFSYDGYKFRRGTWEYRADLDVRNR